MNWIDFKIEQPPDIVKNYIVRNNKQEEFVCLWYEGAYFDHCSGGHWSDEETGEEIKNITHWLKE